MNTKETDTIQPQEQENNENYIGIITFNQKIYAKTVATDLSLKDLRNFMKKLDDLFTWKLIRYFKLYTIEQLVRVQHLHYNIRLRLMTQKIIKKFLSEIPSKDRELIKYVHLQGIQIAAKAYFKEGINSAIIWSLHEQRFKNIQNSHLGTL